MKAEDIINILYSNSFQTKIYKDLSRVVLDSDWSKVAKQIIELHEKETVEPLLQKIAETVPSYRDRKDYDGSAMER